MAAPIFVDAGTGATDAGGAWAYTCQASGAAGRVFVVQILQDGTSTGVVAVTGASNIENLAGTDNAWTQIIGNDSSGADGSFLVGGPAARHFLFIGRALSTSAPTISGTNSTSEDLYIRSYQFTNVSTGTTLTTVVENDADVLKVAVNGAGTSGTIADTGVTTLGPDRLCLNFVAINDDNAVADFTGETGGDWVEAAAEYADASGTDGCIQLQMSPIFSLGSWGVRNPIIQIQGETGAAERASAPFTTVGTLSVTGVYVDVDKVASPTDDLVVEIQTDTAGNPSGTVVGTGGSINGASLSAGAGVTYRIDVSASLSASTNYHLVLSRSGARDTVNFYRWSLGSTAGATESRSSGTWADGPDAFKPIFGLLTATDITGATIDGGTATNVDATDGWGVIGLALIGTTVVTPPASLLPEYGYVNFNDPGVL